MQACDSRGTGLRLIVAMLSVVALSLVGCTSAERGEANGDRPSNTSDTTTNADVGQKVGPLVRYREHRSDVYDKPESWLCRPDVSDDVCDSDMDTTVVKADGTMTVERWQADPDAPIDCFYVYPTISRDSTPYSDMDASDDEEGAAALNQVARLGSECRVFAPIYRQRTLVGLAAVLGGVSTLSDGDTTATDGTAGTEGSAATEGSTAPDGATEGDEVDSTTPFNDVLDAWKTYMANDNNGRGVVLVGHSQGSAILSQLLKVEIDPNPDVRKVLVGAYLAGWGVGVRADGQPGGQLANIPLCSSAGENDCVITWATYRQSGPPPADAIFGRLQANAGDGLVAGCVNPADVAAALGSDPTEAHGYFPADGGASILSGKPANVDPEAAARTWVSPATEPLTTPFVSTPGLLSVRCAEHEGARYLELINNPSDGPRVDDITGDMNAQWGMHLQDVSIVMGDIVNNVRAQSKEFLKRK